MDAFETEAIEIGAILAEQPRSLPGQWVSANAQIWINTFNRPTSLETGWDRPRQS